MFRQEIDRNAVQVNADILSIKSILPEGVAALNRLKHTPDMQSTARKNLGLWWYLRFAVCLHLRCTHARSHKTTYTREQIQYLVSLENT